MRQYRIYILDGKGRIRLAHEIECVDDLTARNEGKLHSGKTAVEVWEGSCLVAILDAPRGFQSGVPRTA